MTTVYLVWAPRVDATLQAAATDDSLEPVDVLVSYLEVEKFLSRKKNYRLGRVFLDSGAYSAWNSGVAINLQEYTGFCKQAKFDEIAGLDVIGDWLETQRNLEFMWDSGVSAIPTYHHGSPVAALDWCAENAPKIALGGVARLGSSKRRYRTQWLQWCFGRVWPKKIHGFGITDKLSLRWVPFHTVDSTSWFSGACAFGSYCGYNSGSVKVPRSHRSGVDLRVEVRHYQRQAMIATNRWASELQILEEQ